MSLLGFRLLDPRKNMLYQQSAILDHDADENQSSTVLETYLLSEFENFDSSRDEQEVKEKCRFLVTSCSDGFQVSSITSVVFLIRYPEIRHSEC